MNEPELCFKSGISYRPIISFLFKHGSSKELSVLTNINFCVCVCVYVHVLDMLDFYQIYLINYIYVSSDAIYILS